MKKVPICLNIDDPAPVVSVYHDHYPDPARLTADGRPVLEYVPNALLEEFCRIVQKHGLRGKYSVVPMPGNRGDILHGLEGVAQEQVQQWLELAKTCVAPGFAIGPEMLTHHKAVDLATGEALPLQENHWAAKQNRETLTPYIAKAVSILRDAGFDVCGVTSPWDFGIEVEEEYAAAISQAVLEVTGKKHAWYFLRSLRGRPNAKPWVQLSEEDRCVVAIPATTTDHMWQTINNPDTSDAYVRQVADELITEDGAQGEIIDVLESGGYPIILTHWQCLVSNGLGTGLRVLETVAERVNRHLSDRVAWTDFRQLMEMVVADPTAYPKPDFS